MANNILDIINQIQSNACTLSYLDLSNIVLSINELKEIKAAVKTNNVIGNIKWGELPIHHESKSIVHAIAVHLRNNVLNFQLYPNAYQFGLLSLHSYYNASVGDVPRLPNDDYNKYLENWRVKAVYHNDSNGYYGALYQNSKNCQLVLAQRGTEFVGLKEELLGHKDISSDINGIVSSKIVYSMFSTYKAVEDSINIAKQTNNHLSFTGHSLGAWLAELSLYFSNKYFDLTTSRAVTFDSPGVGKFFSTLESNIENHHTAFDFKDLDITTYLSIPNIVNSCNKHTGHVYSVTPTITEEQLKQYHNEWSDSHLKSLFLNADSIIPVLTVLGHSLESIIQEFNASTGLPDEYKHMKDWPCLTCNYNYQDHIQVSVASVIGIIPGILANMLFLESVKNLPIYKLANMIVDIAKNKIDLSQYLRVMSDEVTPYVVKQEMRSGQDGQQRLFYLRLEGHFDWDAPNTHFEALTGKHNTPDWYLSQFVQNYYYFSHAPKACDLTSVTLETIIRLSISSEYSSADLHSKYQYGTLNSTVSNITLDQLKQNVVRLNEVSTGTVKKCLDLHKQPELWFGELMLKSGNQDSVMITKEYIDNGGSIDVQDKEGNSLLHIAVANHREEAALLLIENGADTNVSNNAGYNVYDLALNNNELSLANKLQQFHHLSSNSHTIILDKYGIYDGNDQSNIFMVDPDLAGKTEGYKLVIDHFGRTEGNQDKIDLQQFHYHSLNELKLECYDQNFAGRKAVHISNTNVVIMDMSISELDENMFIFDNSTNIHEEL